MTVDERVADVELDVAPARGGRDQNLANGLWTKVASAYSRMRESGDLWYLVAATVVNVANFAFYGLVGHLLPPASYGAVAALLNVVSIAAIPLNALQASVVQATVEQNPDGVTPATGGVGAAFTVASVMTTVFIVAASPLIASFFGLETLVPVVLLALWFAPSISSSLYDGVLIGTLRWRPIAASLIGGAIVRVAITLLLGIVAPSVNVPILATVLNAAVTLGVVLYALRATTRQPTQRKLRVPIRKLLPTILALLGYSALVATDAVLARHILTPQQSGDYAAAVTIGRIALFIPMAITVVIFPRLVAVHGRGALAYRLLAIGLAATLVLGLAAAAILALFSHLAVATLFSHQYDGSRTLVGILSAEGALLGALSLLTYFHLARGSLFAAAPGLTTVIVAAVVLETRPTAHELAWTMVIAAAACLLLMLLGAVPENWRPRRTAGP